MMQCKLPAQFSCALWSAPGIYYRYKYIYILLFILLDIREAAHTTHTTTIGTIKALYRCAVVRWTYDVRAVVFRATEKSDIHSL